MRFLKPVLALSLLAMLAAAAVPPAAGDAAGAADLGGIIDAGDFRAARLRLLEPAGLEVGGVFWDPVGTDQPVLPIFAAIRTADGAGAFAVFAYDFHFDQPLTTALQVTTPDVIHRIGNAVTYDVQGGGWITFSELPAGEYVLVVAAAPGTGQAEVKMRTFGATEVVAVQDGTTFYDRGLDRSDYGYDVFVTGNQGAPAGTHVRAWGYTGADVPFQVAGRMYGFVGYHQGTATWSGPSGSFLDFVIDEPGGAWTAAFPQETYEGPICLPRAGCDPGFGDTREDPPFAIAADVSV